MDKSDLERRLEAAEKQNIGLMDEIKNLKAKLAEMQDEPEIPDFPVFKNYENAFFCDSDELYERFHTEEYAVEFAKKCKLIAMMLHCKWYLDRDYVPDWNNSDENKYYVFYNNFTNGFGVTVRTLSESVAFSNEESARKCADWLNKHWKEDGDG